jgi:hypothetical protein
VFRSNLPFPWLLSFLISNGSASTLLAQETVGPAVRESVPSDRPYGAFVFRDSVHLRVSPGEAFDRFLEVDAWWDHRFSQDPHRFFIEPRPGGGFYEIFDETGDGVLHATVIFVRRGEVLRMRGPLGLSGYAIDMVFTLNFEATPSGTSVRLEVRGAGEIEAAWPGVVQDVWRHFLAERYRTYVEGTLG